MLLICVHDTFVVTLFMLFMFPLACLLALAAVSLFPSSKAKGLAELPLGGAIGTGTKPAVFSLIS